MACTAAVYENRDYAVRAKQQVLKTYKIPVSVYHCEKCDRYHIEARPGQEIIDDYSLKILNYYARGYRQPDIASMMGCSSRTVEEHLRIMRDRLYALNNVNLLAIVIALGIVKPNDFVPEVGERIQA